MNAICGNSMDSYLGVPAPTRPKCANGHRAILMHWRVRLDGYICRHCGRHMSEKDNIARSENAWWRARIEAVEAALRSME